MTGIDDSAVGHALRDGERSPTAEPASTATTATPTPSGTVPAGRLTGRGRPRKWDRPPPPHDWRWWASHVGRVMVAVGLLMFGFVAYQLWGTGIETARAQRSLEREFDELLAASPAIDPAQAVELPVAGEPPDPSGAPADGTGDAPGEADATEIASDATPAAGEDPSGATTAVLPVEAQNLPAFGPGDAIGRIEIPAIGVDDIVVAGVTTGVLKKGPGHFPGTPLPGQLGNAAIAGHRTTFGQPFFDVDELVPGDEIVMTTLTGTYVYRVTGQEIVPPSAGHVVATTDPTRATLTLTSCDPKWTARDRIVIYSELDAAASSIVGEPVLDYGTPAEDAVATVATDEATTAVDDEPTTTDAATTAGEPTTDAATTAGDPTTTDAATTAGDDPTTDAAATTAGDDGERTAAPPIELAAPGATASAADAFGEGWFADPAANPHVAFWGVLLALIGVGAYLISRRFRHDWVGALVGIVPFVLTLYFFFQNVNRLLPPNL